ncbi:MAG TPA: hypothetical protein VFL14_11830, partial [Xanthomonadales bacterium]|nr:hypothetical protein [Xanthomonadales bacterium]
MKISDIPFGKTDWSTAPATEHAGETGVATWRSRQFGKLRVHDRGEHPSLERSSVRHPWLTRFRRAMPPA